MEITFLKPAITGLVAIAFFSVVFTEDKIKYIFLRTCTLILIYLVLVCSFYYCQLNSGLPITGLPSPGRYEILANVNDNYLIIVSDEEEKPQTRYYKLSSQLIQKKYVNQEDKNSNTILIQKDELGITNITVTLPQLP